MWVSARLAGRAGDVGRVDRKRATLPGPPNLASPNQCLLTDCGEAMPRCSMDTENLINRQSMADRRWYALYVRPHQEVVVAQHLALRGIEFYLALYSAVHVWKNRCSKHLELPLFPGYIFVHIGPWERVSVLGVQGVVHLVGTPGRPIPLPDDEIEALRIGIAERNPQPHPPLAEGQRVRIRRGALAGLEG